MNLGTLSPFFPLIAYKRTCEVRTEKDKSQLLFIFYRIFLKNELSSLSFLQKLRCSVVLWQHQQPQGMVHHTGELLCSFSTHISILILLLRIAELHAIVLYPVEKYHSAVPCFMNLTWKRNHMLYIFRSYILCHLLTDFTDKALQCLQTFMNAAVMSLTFASSAQYTKDAFLQ